MKIAINQRRPRDRNGIATLEFVFSLPVLMFMMAGIFSLGFKGKSESAVATTARNEAWIKRPSPPSSARPLAVVSDAAADTVEADTEEQFRIWLVFSASNTAKSSAAVLTGTWDHTQVRGIARKGPHFSVLKNMTANSVSGLGAFARQLRTFEDLLNFNISMSSVASRATSQLSSQLSGLQQQAASLRQTIRTLHASLDAAKRAFSVLSEIAKLSGTGRRLAREIDRLTEKIDQMQDALEQIEQFTHAFGQ